MHEKSIQYTNGSYVHIVSINRIFHQNYLQNYTFPISIFTWTDLDYVVTGGYQLSSGLLGYSFSLGMTGGGLLICLSRDSYSFTILVRDEILSVKSDISIPSVDR